MDDDSEKKIRFARENGHILALNYENLCDSEYVGTLFDSSFDCESSVTIGVPTEKCALQSSPAEELADDIAVFGNDDSAGVDLFLHRWKREQFVGPLNNDIFSLQLRRQCAIVNFMRKLMIEELAKPFVSRAEQNPIQHDLTSKRSQFFSSIALESCLSTVNAKVHLDDEMFGKRVKPLISTLMQFLNPEMWSIPIAGSLVSHSQHHHLRILFDKCFQQLSKIQLTELNNWRRRTFCDHVHTVSYGIFGHLALGMICGSSADILVAVNQLLLLIMVIEERMDYVLAQLQDELSVCTVVSSSKHVKQFSKSKPTNRFSLQRVISQDRKQEDITNSFCSTADREHQSAGYSQTSVSSTNGTLLTGPTKNKEKNSAIKVGPDLLRDAVKAKNHSKSFKIEGKMLYEILERPPAESVSCQPAIVVNHALVPNAIMNNNKPVKNNVSARDVDARTHLKRLEKDINDTFQTAVRLPQAVIQMINDYCTNIDGSLSAKLSSSTRPLSETVKMSSSASSRVKKYKSTNVWSCGQNSYGELGHGDVAARKTFSRIEALCDKAIISIGAGNEVSLFVSRDGKLFSAGYNDNGQCGIGSTQQVRQPAVVQSLEDEEIHQVFIGNGCEHALSLTRDGKVFAFGYNYRGQLGLGSTGNELLPRQIRTLMSRKVIVAACSYHHSMFYCSDGALFSCGRNDSGQLGHGDTIDKKTPQAVLSAPRNLTSISCGLYHSALVANNGFLYVCGKNDYGQLGMETTTHCKVFTKIQLPELDSVIQVTCGYYHTLLLTTTGMVAGFGRNDYGQLGLGTTLPKIYNSSIISSLRDKGVTLVCAGCYHSVAVTNNGMLYVFGRNNHGQLATGDLEERHCPFPVDNFVGQRIISVAAGFYHTLVLTGDRSIDFDPPFSATSSAMDVDCSSSSVSDADPKYLAALLRRDLEQLCSYDSQNRFDRRISKLEPVSSVSFRELFIIFVKNLSNFDQYDQSADSHVNSPSTQQEESFCVVIRSILSIIIACWNIVSVGHHANIPLSQDDALGLLRKVLPIVVRLLINNRDMICAAKPSTDEIESATVDVSWLHLDHALSIDSLLNFSRGKTTSNVSDIVNQLRSLFIRLYYGCQAHRESEPVMFDGLSSSICDALFGCREIFFMNVEIYVNILVSVNDSFHVSCSDGDMLEDSPHLKLLITFARAFQNLEDSISLFQRSKDVGLRILQSLQKSHYVLSFIYVQRPTAVQGPRGLLFRKTIAGLEQSISSLLKCALPVLLSGEEQFRARCDSFFFSIFENVELMLNSVRTRVFDEENLSRLRQGTILPSILPTILLHALATRNNQFLSSAVEQLRRVTDVLHAICDAEIFVMQSKWSLDKRAPEFTDFKDDEISKSACEEVLYGRKDHDQVSWWYRLLRICSALLADRNGPRMSHPVMQRTDIDIIHLRSHPVWTAFALDEALLLHLSNADLLTEFVTTVKCSDMDLELSEFRMKAMADDPMYRMVLSGRKTFDGSSWGIDRIEYFMFSTTLRLCGGLNYLTTAHKHAISMKCFCGVMNFSKFIFSKKSLLMTTAGLVSWRDVITCVSKIVSIVSLATAKLTLRFDVRTLSPLPLLKVKSLRWRKALLLVLCANRWKNYFRQRRSVVDMKFIEFCKAFLVTLTNDFKVLPNLTEAANLLSRVFSKMSDRSAVISSASNRLKDLCLLLERYSLTTVRLDIMDACRSTLRKIVKMNQAEHESNPSCWEFTLRDYRCNVKSLARQFIGLLTEFANTSSISSLVELDFVSRAVQMNQLLLYANRIHDINLPIIPFEVCEKIVVLLSQKISLLSSTCDDKSSSKRGPSFRERTFEYKRAWNSIVSYMQSVIYCAIQRPIRDSFELLRHISSLSKLLSVHQRLRLMEMLISKDEGQGEKSKDSKKRCQDLVAGPVEFSKASEGVMIQGDKLINNCKGMDFSIAAWIFASENNGSSSKTSFLLGRVTHSEMWPLLLLRQDRKLELLFGHSNEYEKLVSEATISAKSWVHVAVIVEQKKMKLFIDGVLDSQITTTRGNPRSLLYPLIFGSCPPGFRSKVVQIRDGFFGMIALCKYYSRALSPIHVRVVFDQGPPEALDVSSKICFQLLATLKILVVNLDKTNSESERIQDLAELAHETFIGDSQRKNRYAALELLRCCLATESMTQIRLSRIDVGSPQGVERQSISLMDVAPKEVIDFRDRVIYYFLRIAGVFWVHMTSSNKIESSRSDFGDSLAYSPLVTMKRLLFEHDKNFGHYGSQLWEERMSSLDEPFGELTFKALSTLTSLGKNSELWHQSLTRVVHDVLTTYTNVAKLARSYSTTEHMEAVAVSFLIGGIPHGSYLGAFSRDKLEGMGGYIVSIQRSISSAALYYRDEREDFKVNRCALKNLQPIELVHFELSEKMSIELLTPVEKLLEVLCPYVELLCRDYLSFSAESSLVRNVLAVLCPLEGVVLQKLLSALTLWLPSPSIALTGRGAILKSIFPTLLRFASYLNNFKVLSSMDCSDGNPDINALWARSMKDLCATNDNCTISSHLPQPVIDALDETIMKYLKAGPSSAVGVEMRRSGGLFRAYNDGIHHSSTSVAVIATTAMNERIKQLDASDFNVLWTMCLALRHQIITGSVTLVQRMLSTSSSLNALVHNDQIAMSSFWPHSILLFSRFQNYFIANLVNSKFLRTRSSISGVRSFGEFLQSSLEWSSDSNTAIQLSGITKMHSDSLCIQLGLSFLSNGNIEDLCSQILTELLPVICKRLDSSMPILLQSCIFAVRLLCEESSKGLRVSEELISVINTAVDSIRPIYQSWFLRYRGHNHINVDYFTFGLSQLTCSLELIQRKCCESEVLTIKNDAGEAIGKAAMQLLFAKVQCIKTFSPSVVSTGATFVELDLSNCVQSIRCSEHRDVVIDAGLTRFLAGDVVLEVAIGIGTNSSPEMYFETVYCGTSLRVVQSGLLTGSTYQLRCRLVCGSIPLSWSSLLEIRTKDGPLFKFDALKSGRDIVLANEGATATYSGDDSWSTILADRSFSSGITNWEIRINHTSTAYIFVGVATSAADLTTFLGGCGGGWGFIGEQALYHNREKVKVYGESFSSGDIIGVCLNLTVGTLSFSKNGKSLGVAFDRVYGDLYPAVAFYNAGQELRILDNAKTSALDEPIPVAPTRLGLDDMALLTEMLLLLRGRSFLSRRLAAILAENCNQWCSSSSSRCRTISGKDIYLMTNSSLLKRFNLVVGERVRTHYGIAEVAGVAFNRIWFRLNLSGDVWFFVNSQVTEGKTRRLFSRSSYASDDTEAETCSVHGAGKDVASWFSFDASSIAELLDPTRWCEEMDVVLLTFMQTKSTLIENKKWHASADQIFDSFRDLQRQLSKIIMSKVDLAQKWGIKGPKRKAVIARIDFKSSTVFRSETADLEKFFSSVGQYSSCSNRDVFEYIFPCGTTLSTIPFRMEWDQLSKQTEILHDVWAPPLQSVRKLVFKQTKLDYFYEAIRKSSLSPTKTEDDYDYPDNLPIVKINRLKAFRSREQVQSNESASHVLEFSIFGQLWGELRQYSDEQLRISYTHPMDDGQTRTFKVKFEGEGVDDYGGPYREVFSQICSELQSLYVAPQPTGSKSAVSEQTSPRCLLQFLRPTPNWNQELDIAEKYCFSFAENNANSRYLELCRFFGQVIGFAIRSRITLDLQLPTFIWKCLVAETLTKLDLASFDQSTYILTQRVQNMIACWEKYQSDPTTRNAQLWQEERCLLDELTWTCIDSYGTVQELRTGGSTCAVAPEDMRSYLLSLIAYRFGEHKKEILLMREGIISVIPESALSLLTGEELKSIVCGSKYLDVDLLLENTEYDEDVSKDDPHIAYFWSVLREFDEIEKSAFLRFVWARPSLPPKGCEFTQKMRVLNVVSDDPLLAVDHDSMLPKAHTCFFSINLPKYSSKKIMEEKLRYAILNCTEMDGDFRVTDSHVPGWTAAADSSFIGLASSPEFLESISRNF